MGRNLPAPVNRDHSPCGRQTHQTANACYRDLTKRGGAHQSDAIGLKRMHTMPSGAADRQPTRASPIRMAAGDASA